MTDSGNDNNQDNVSNYFKKKAIFVQHSIPVLTAGKYELSVQQSLSHPAEQPVDPKKELPDKFPSMTKTFGVQAPRYALPKTAVHSVFPPENFASTYSNSLAHIVFNQEKLPWLRSPYTPENVPEPSFLEDDGEPVDRDRATWLTVLVLSPSDFAGQDPVRLIKQGTVTDLVPDNMKAKKADGSTVAGTLPHTTHYSQFSYGLESGPGVVDVGIGSHPSDTCHYIDLPAKLFNALAPSLADLEIMAHVREVVMSDKPIADNQKVKVQEAYSIVIGNRLPESLPKPVGGKLSKKDPAGSNVAMLVSLENMEFALAGHSGTSYYDSNISTNPSGVVRLAVLKNWSFTSWYDDSYKFEQLLKSLNGRIPVTEHQGDVLVPNPLMRLPNPPSYPASASDEEKIVETMLRSGYVPMNHITRVPVGNDPIQTVSWYRGPLLPFKKSASVLPPFTVKSNGAPIPNVFSADALLRFDPQVGMYDASYAVAWQLGRLLSLSDKAFSIPLYQLKRRVEAEIKLLLEGNVLIDKYSPLLAMHVPESFKLQKPLDIHEQVYQTVLSYLKSVVTN